MSEDNPFFIAKSGFLARRHDRLRFTELTETFFGRLILSKCPDVNCSDAIHVRLNLADLYRRASPQVLADQLGQVTFKTTNKITELITDGLNEICGGSLQPHGDSQPALEYFTRHMKSRLQWLKTGEKSDEKPACIEDYEYIAEGPLPTFSIKVRPAVLVQGLARAVEIDLELKASLMRQLLLAGAVQGDQTLRIDYRKQVDSLLKFLDERQRNTGEREFCIQSNQFPFRWALSYIPSGFAMSTPGTTTAEDKILLPLLLEINGLLDIHSIDLISDPTEPNDVIVRFFIARPASGNLFAATSRGLKPASRSRLSEAELCLYERMHNELRENLVFGARPKIEVSFGEICSWLVRKAAYCLEEPTFLRDRALAWLTEHVNDKRVEIENDFFLPFMYERMREEFGARVVKKPERFAGEIDILFDNEIPVELKVRRGKRDQLASKDLDESFRPGGQAAAYATVSRLGFVVVLDLPEGDRRLVNLESCGKS